MDRKEILRCAQDDHCGVRDDYRGVRDDACGARVMVAVFGMTNAAFRADYRGVRGDYRGVWGDGRGARAMVAGLGGFSRGGTGRKVFRVNWRWPGKVDGERARERQRRGAGATGDVAWPDEDAGRGAGSHIVPVGVWIAVQLLALSLGVMQTPLSDRFPRPAEGMALHEMVVVQVVASALLFPLLLRSWESTMMLMAISWPFAQLAGVLASAPAGRALAAAGYVSMWLAVLGVWGSVLRGRRWQLAGVAIASGLAVGGPMLWYLRAEFAGNTAAVEWARDAWLGPVMGVLAIVREEPAAAGAWMMLASVLALGTAARVIVRWRRAH